MSSVRLVLLLSFLFSISCIEGLLSTLSLQSLNITYPSHSYRGAAAIYNKTLYSWNGYECNISSYSQCSTSNQVTNTTNILHTLDISELFLTSTTPRTINESLISPDWQTSSSIDPIYVRPSDSSTWPSMITGTSTSSYTASSHFGWVVFPSGGDYRTKFALKFDLNLKQFVNTSTYNSEIPSTKRWSGACNANDGIRVYAINGRGTDNFDQTDSVWVYHIKNDTWTQGSKHPKSLFEPSCAIINGILYSLGGQDGGGMNTRITEIYGYNTATNTWLNSKNKVGDLIQARHHAISVSHPNGWIITAGGRGTNDLHSDIIELFDPVSGQSFDTQMRYSMQGMFHARYSYDADTAILFLWGGLYNPNNLHVSIHNEIKYIILSKYDAIYPTTAPTNAPSLAPSFAPSFSPTSKTDQPTNDPTNDPTYDPTSDPTIIPTNIPTSDPTIIPTNIPTTNPTLNPTGPIYLNDAEVTEFVTTAFEKDAPNIIVNIVNDDKWLVIAIVVIVFMILCFVCCIYWIYHRYNSKKMNRNFNVMDVSSPATTDGAIQTETTHKTGSDQIEIELVSAENIEGGANDTTSKVVPDENSESSDNDRLYETNDMNTQGNDDGNKLKTDNDDDDDMYIETKGIITVNEMESPGNVTVSNGKFLEDNETKDVNDSDSDVIEKMYDKNTIITTGK